MLVNFQQKGFSLIEIAVSLVIIGVLLGGITIPLSDSFKNTQMRNNVDRVDATREAILGFVIRNQRLPCPAKAWEDTTNPEYEGVEACDMEVISSLPSSNVEKACDGEDITVKNLCSGLLPWKTLGIQRLDSWGNPLFYSVDRRLTIKTSFQEIARNNQNLDNIKIKGRAQEDNAAYTIADNVAAVFGSFGRYNLSFNALTGVITLPDASNTTDEAENIKSCCTTLPINNSNNKKTFYQRLETTDDNTVDEAGNRIGSFDDQIAWIPFYQLLGIMAKTDRLYTD